MSEAGQNLEGLLCALVLAPSTYSRNRFYGLFTNAAAQKTRRRASRLRSIVRQLSVSGAKKAELTGEQLLEDGQVVIRYRLTEVSFSRTVALRPIEASLIRYALHRAQGTPLEARDKERVEEALKGLYEPSLLDTPESASSSERSS